MRRNTIKLAGYSTWNSKLGDPVDHHYLYGWSDNYNANDYIIGHILNNSTVVFVHKKSLRGLYVRFLKWYTEWRKGP